MKRALKISAWVLGSLLALLLLLGSAAAWYVHSKQPQRSASVSMRGLSAPVSVRYDERGVPHIRAENDPDLYRTLGWVHAQDRLFQMEMVRRLAKGELAEVLGPKLVEVDRLFRTLGIARYAREAAAKIDLTSASTKALIAYLDGINQYQASHPAPMEFDLLGIPKKPFTLQDTLAVSGYLAYSFAAAFRTEPALTYVRDKLGPDYLRVFDLDWKPQGVVGAESSATALTARDWRSLNRLAQVSEQAFALAGVAPFEGSNAWVVAGSRTRSGKPLLSGDPHIAYAAPAVWYEAQLSSPGFDLYGHFQALNPSALLGHNQQFGWSLTMFQNDDMDLIAEKRNPANANQVRVHGKWVELQTYSETIKVKGDEPVTLKLRRSPHGPIITDAFKDSLGNTPVAMWWSFLETDNPILDAFYELNRANTLGKARAAAEKIHAPGLNVVWANASGDIAWWAAAKLPIRPGGVNPAFILDGSSDAADKLGFLPFSANPHEENPARGYIVSANHQPRNGVAVAGYYNLADRAGQLDARLRDPAIKWDIPASQALQLDTRTGYGLRLLAPLLPVLDGVVTGRAQRDLLQLLVKWDGSYGRGSVAATIFNQFLYEVTKLTMADPMGEVQFKNLLATRAIDSALPRLMADEKSPWWQRHGSKRNREDVVKAAWDATVRHLRATLGEDPAQWSWGRSHTLTHKHPLAAQKPLDKLFNIGPFDAPGSHEVPNNLSSPIGPAPWAVSYGPSTRRTIDFADAGSAMGINPVGQSGVLFDTHYQDQAASFIAGKYQPMHLGASDVAAHVSSMLMVVPQP